MAVVQTKYGGVSTAFPERYLVQQPAQSLPLPPPRKKGAPTAVGPLPQSTVATPTPSAETLTGTSQQREQQIQQYRQSISNITGQLNTQQMPRGGTTGNLTPSPSSIQEQLVRNQAKQSTVSAGTGYIKSGDIGIVGGYGLGEALVQTGKNIFFGSPDYVSGITEPAESFLFGESQVIEPIGEDVFPKLFRRGGRGTEITNPLFQPTGFKSSAEMTPGELQIETSLSRGVEPGLVGLPSKQAAENIYSKTESAFYQDISTAQPYSGTPSVEGDKLYRTSGGVIFETQPYETYAEGGEVYTIYRITEESAKQLSKPLGENISSNIDLKLGPLLYSEKLAGGVISGKEKTKEFGKMIIETVPYVAAYEATAVIGGESLLTSVGGRTVPFFQRAESLASTALSLPIIGSGEKKISESILNKDYSFSQRAGAFATGAGELGLGLVGVNLAIGGGIKKVKTNEGVFNVGTSMFEKETMKSYASELLEPKKGLTTFYGTPTFVEEVGGGINIELPIYSEKVVSGNIKSTTEFTLQTRVFNDALFGRTESGQEVLIGGGEKVSSAITKAKVTTSIPSFTTGEVIKSSSAFGGQISTNIFSETYKMPSFFEGTGRAKGLRSSPGILNEGTAGISTGFIELKETGERYQIKIAGIAKRTEKGTIVYGGPLKSIKFKPEVPEQIFESRLLNVPEIKFLSEKEFVSGKPKRFKEIEGLYYPRKSPLEPSRIVIKKGADKYVLPHELAHAIFDEYGLYRIPPKTNIKVYAELEKTGVINYLKSKGYKLERYSEPFTETFAYVHEPSSVGGLGPEGFLDIYSPKMQEALKRNVPKFYKHYFSKTLNPAKFTREAIPSSTKAFGEISFEGFIYNPKPSTSGVIKEIESSSGGRSLIQVSKETSKLNQPSFYQSFQTPVTTEISKSGTIINIQSISKSLPVQSTSAYYGMGLYERTSGGLQPGQLLQIEKQRERFVLPGQISAPVISSNNMNKYAFVISSPTTTEKLFQLPRGGQKQFSGQGQILKQAQVTRQVQDYGFTAPSPTVTTFFQPTPTTPFLPPIILPSFSFGETYSYRKGRKVKSPKYRYQASFTSGILGIKAPKMPRKFGGGENPFSRPLIVPARRSRKKKR